MTVGDFSRQEDESTSGNGGSMERLLDRLQKFASKNGPEKIVIHDCSNKKSALDAFRFVAATAFRTWCVGEGAQGISVDYALPKNGGSAPPTNSDPDSPALATKPIKRMRYSHFGCNVVHEDLGTSVVVLCLRLETATDDIKIINLTIVLFSSRILAYGPDVDVHKEKHLFKKIVEFQCGGRLPAEHGHGTEYSAPKETQDRWKKMDPLNVLNPGIGGLSEKPRYRE